MIRVRLSSLGDHSGDLKVKIVKDELLVDAVYRALESIPADTKIEETFQVLVNGMKIDSHLWQYTRLNKEDNVLIAPFIKGNDSERYQLGQALTIVAIAVAAAFTGGAVAAGEMHLLTSVAINLGVSMAATMIFTQMFPPPDLDANTAGSVEDSQMYRFSGQSNQTSKFGFVPKVYGKHRIYPNIAANPYTELESDGKGNMVQYLYAIYDFGLGPMTVRDIKIGDTPISNYSDYSVRLVDFNRPATDEGVWDEDLYSTLLNYKGDVESDSASISLNENQASGGALSGYQAVRNSAVSTVPQEITLNFVCPAGLIGYSSTGQTSNGLLDLEVEFAKVGTEDWRPYNDLNYVASFKDIGGDEVTKVTTYNVAISFSYNLSQVKKKTIQPVMYTNFGTLQYERTEYWGLAKGSTYIVIEPGSGLEVGAILKQGDYAIGTVSSIVTSGYGGKYRVNFVSPTTRIFEFFTLVIVGDTYWNASYDPVTSLTESVGVNNTAITRSKILLKKFRINAKTIDPVYSTVKFAPKEVGEFKVRVTRVSTSFTYSSTYQSDLTWVNIVTRRDSAPIITDKRHTFLELKIKATGQLNGSIQNLSAVCTSVLDVWNGTAWVKEETQNPAWVFCDILTGPVNKRAVAKTRLDVASIKEWADYCDEIPPDTAFFTYVHPRFESNFVLDFNSTVQSLVAQVTSSAQASMNLVDGKYGVLLDTVKTVPVQVFTPRNSRGFSSVKYYPKKPHALKVKYIDPSADWGQSERVVYDEGYDVNTATEFEEMSSFACTSMEQAWRFGRYSLFQNRLRQEVMTLEVDFEHLVCSRGDYVQITQDTMKVGGTPARVKSVVGNRITIDDGIETSGLISYGYVYRASTGEIRTNTLTVVNADTFDLAGTPLPQVGDLVIIGEVGKIVYDCLVKTITPSSDLTASLTLIEKADGVYGYETDAAMPVYSPQISQTVDPNFLPPGEVADLEVIANTWRFTGAAYEYYVTLDWDVPTGSAAESYEIYVDNGRGYNLVDTTRESLYEYIVSLGSLGVEHFFKVIAVSSTGKKLDLGAVGFVTATPLKKLTSPSDVTNLSIDITGEVLQLVWQRITDVDTREYLIRYSPLTSGTWEASIPLMRVDKNTSLAATQARTGTYLIKAVDYNDNESVHAGTAITTIPELLGLNVINTVTDFPTLIGSMDSVTKNGDTLVLAKTVFGGVETTEYRSEGYYYYADLLDLGEIYTVRLQSLIQAEGFTAEDVLSNWVTLDTVTFMANSKFSEWDVKSQYRGTNSYNTIADWVTLDLVASMSEGADDNWTEWRDFVIGDATFRIAQFRLKLISNKTSVTPRVFDGTIKADMPDRSETMENLISGVGSYQVNYSVPFKGPGTSPNIQISIDGAQSGDYWVFNSKTLSGFNISFYDNTNTIVSRQFDVAVKGYGRRTLNVI